MLLYISVIRVLNDAAQSMIKESSLWTHRESTSGAFFNESSQVRLSYRLEDKAVREAERENGVAGQSPRPPGVVTSCKRQPIGHPIRTRSGETGSVAF